MDEKSLQEQLRKEELRYWFCPQINAPCDHNCYCYIPAEINRDVIAHVTDAFCIHVLHQELAEFSIINND